MSNGFRCRRLAAGLDVASAAEAAGIEPAEAAAMDRGRRPEPHGVARRLDALADPVLASPRSGRFRMVDLFAGIGGMRVPFDRRGGDCVMTCEWDARARETYAANFGVGPEGPPVGDVRELHGADVPDHDLLLAGFPCQAFSLAGVSKKNALGRAHGFADVTQGTLFFDLARIIAAKRPAAFVLENVRNLVSHDRGRTFEVIRRTLQERLGYAVSFRVMNAKGLVPQNRERIFIVGLRDGVPFDPDSVDVPEPSSGPRMSAVLHPEDGTEAPEPHYTVGDGAAVSDRYVLSDHLWTYLRGYADKHRSAGNGFGYGLVGPDDTARTLSARYHKDGSEVLVDRGAGANPRRLTPRECARLMGYVPPWTPGGREMRIPVADTAAYRQFGNSVAVPVVDRIAERLAPRIDEAMRRPDAGGDEAVRAAREAALAERSGGASGCGAAA